LQVVVGFAISALAIYLLWHQIDVDKLLPRLADVKPEFAALVVVTVVTSLATRAARWRVFFKPELDVPFVPLVETRAISYMASTILPLRAGELVRALFLGQRAAVSVPRVVGTIVLEKLFDFLAVGVILVILLMLEPLPDVARAAGFSVFAAIIFGFGFVVALAILRSPTLSFVRFIEEHLPFGLRRLLPLTQAARHFAEGTDSLRVPALWLPILGWTTLTWLLSLGSVWAGMAALGVLGNWPAILLVAVVTSASQAVPSSPGYVGVYHLVATNAMATFGIDTNVAAAIALITHAFSYGSLVIAGLIALWTGGYTFADVLSGVSGRKTTTTKPAVALASER
jgi:uncharacterized protein (TIRG00374 family)